MKEEKYRRVRDHFYYTGETELLHIAYVIYNIMYLKKILIVFRNGSNNGYHFIIKQLAEEFKKQSTSLGKNTEKYISITAPIEKELTRIYKNGEELIQIWQAYYQILSIICVKKFIKLNVDMDTMINNVKISELNVSIATVFLKYTNFEYKNMI